MGVLVLTRKFQSGRMLRLLPADAFRSSYVCMDFKLSHTETRTDHISADRTLSPVSPTLTVTSISTFPIFTIPPTSLPPRQPPSTTHPFRMPLPALRFSTSTPPIPSSSQPSHRYKSKPSTASLPPVGRPTSNQTLSTNQSPAISLRGERPRGRQLAVEGERANEEAASKQMRDGQCGGAIWGRSGHINIRPPHQHATSPSTSPSTSPATSASTPNLSDTPKPATPSHPIADVAADLAVRLADEAAEVAVADSVTAVALLREVGGRRGGVSEEVAAGAVGVASRCASLGDGGGAVLDALAEGGWRLPRSLILEGLSRDSSLQIREVTGGEGGGKEGARNLLNSLFDLLWRFNRGATASALLQICMEENIFPDLVLRVDEFEWGADLSCLGPGGTLTALHTWFLRMQGASLEGRNCATKEVVLTTSKFDDVSGVSGYQTIRLYFHGLGSPFRPIPDGSFVIRGYSLERWLKDSPHCADLELVDRPTNQTNCMVCYKGALVQPKVAKIASRVEECGLGYLRPKMFGKLMRSSEEVMESTLAMEIESRPTRRARTEAKADKKNRRKVTRRRGF